MKLTFDTEVLGIPIARLNPASLNTEALRTALAHLKQAGIALVYWTVQENDREANAAAQAHQGLLVDTKITYIQTSHSRDSKPLQNFNIIPYLQKAPSNELLHLAFQIGKQSRFSKDPRLPPASAEKIYTAWLSNTLNGQLPTETYLVQQHEKTVAFFTLQDKDTRGEILFIAVHPDYQHQGIGKIALSAAISALQQSHFEIVQIVTQRHNQAACALYQKMGFIAEKNENVYHFWL